MAAPLSKDVSATSDTLRAKLATIDWRYLLYVQLHGAGFAATTTLLVWGLLVLVVLAMGGLSLDGLMAQLDNLATRYVEADGARRNRFKLLVFIIQLFLGIVIIVARRRSILPPERARKGCP